MSVKTAIADPAKSLMGWRMFGHKEGAWQLWLPAFLLVIPGLYLLLHLQFSMLIAGSLLVLSAVAWRMNPGAAILAIFGFLLTLGDIRRVVSWTFEAPTLDPLILVGTVFATFAALPILLRVRVSDLISKTVLALTCVMVLEIFNPRQGPFSVGLSGALFYLTPLFWFWIGRKFGRDQLVLSLMYNVIVPAGILGALLGIAQTYVGFLPWEKAWITRSLALGYTALNLGGGHIRSFGFSSNGTEYGNLLMISGIFMIAGVLTGRRIYLLFLPLVFTAQLLASQRSPIVKLFVAAAVLWALRSAGGKNWLPRLVAVIVLGVGALAYSGSHGGSADQAAKGSSADYATTHVTSGLSHPFNSKYSTAGIHFQMFRDGILVGIKNPIGAGLGAVTLGSGKFGSGSSGINGSSEVDISDAFITMGIVGGLLYLITIVSGMKCAFDFCRNGPQRLSFPIMGLLICMLLVWIPLGEYAVGPLVWFCIGFLVRRTNEDRSMRDQLATN